MMNCSLGNPNIHEKNIVRKILKTSIYGKPHKPNSILQDHHFVVDHLNSFTNNEIKSLYDTVRELEEVLKSFKPDRSKTFSIFWEVKLKIFEVSKAEDGERLNSRFSESVLWLKKEILNELTRILQRFILSYTIFPSTKSHLQEKGEILQMKGVALEILHDVFVQFENLAPPFSEDHRFLLCLFTYLQFLETCFPACRILECLLLSRKKLLDLSTIGYLKEMVSCFDDVALGNFCKILAVTLSELDMYEHKTSLYAQTKQKKTQNFYVRDINQDVVLKIPKILPRLVNLACAKPYVPWFPNANMESEQWLKWIDKQCTQEIDTRNTSNFVGGITEWNKSGVLGPEKSSIKIASELTFRADAVCVLGLLLVGRHRKEVQKELAELQLIPRLSNLFDHFLWRSSAQDYTRLPGHNSSCECSPEVALKIQVLRLIHSFCDHSDYKHVMLSWSEYSEMQELQVMRSSSGSFTPPPYITRESMCTGANGFLTKIVEVMKKENGASTFRFWLSRAIESYLRGSHSGTDQDFLLRRNLLQHVVDNLITSGIRHKEVLQSSFDLLGELVRFNIYAFRELNSSLHQVVRQKKLLSLMNVGLVDSNMFIRSLILSYENFITSNNPEEKLFAERHCAMLSHVSSRKVRLTYLRKLLRLINIHNLTQENVSCLNTALVILMFAMKKNELPQYLQVLAAIRDGCSVATNNQSGLMDNLKDLLLFWQDHYLQKDKDCSILEKSSRICFQEWRDTVAILTRDDPQNPNSLSFYSMPALSSRAS